MHESFKWIVEVSYCLSDKKRFQYNIQYCSSVLVVVVVVVVCYSLRLLLKAWLH